MVRLFEFLTFIIKCTKNKSKIYIYSLDLWAPEYIASVESPMLLESVSLLGLLSLTLRRERAGLAMENVPLWGMIPKTPNDLAHFI